MSLYLNKKRRVMYDHENQDYQTRLVIFTFMANLDLFKKNRQKQTIVTEEIVRIRKYNLALVMATIII